MTESFRPPGQQVNKPKQNAQQHPFKQNVFKQQRGNPVSKFTKVVGRRIAGTQRAEFARQQKRRDTRH